MPSVNLINPSEQFSVNAASIRESSQSELIPCGPPTAFAVLAIVYITPQNHATRGTHQPRCTMSRPSTPSMPSITIAEYLLTRLTEIGLKDIFGVPGDFNLSKPLRSQALIVAFLDYIEDDPKLHWIGTSNELNGRYCCILS